jgi:hypothetical protein
LGYLTSRARGAKVKENNKVVVVRHRFLCGPTPTPATQRIGEAIPWAIASMRSVARA